MAEDKERGSLKVAEKLLLATLVRDNKELLLGEFNRSKGVTKISQKMKWVEIYNELKAMGAEIRDDTHLRKNIWGNMRRQTIKKQADSKKTGAAGCQLKPYEVIVLEVVGKESPLIDGTHGTRDAPPSFSSMNDDSSSVSDMNISPSKSIDTQDNTNFFRRPFTPTQSTSSVRHDVPGPSGQFLTPIRGGATRNTSSGDIGGSSFRQKKGKVPQSILMDSDYKEMRLKKLELELQLIQAQIEESKERSDFYRRAGFAIQNGAVMAINSNSGVQIQYS